MGRVLSPQEVATKKICTLETFQATVASIKKRLAASPDIVGAALLGTALGGFTIRSDVDIIVVVRRQGYVRAMAMLQRVHLYAAKRSVAVDLIVLDDELARTSLHTIDLLFHAEAERCLERHVTAVVKENPLPFILPIGTDTRTIARDYLRAKLRKLEKLWIRVPPLSVQPRLIKRNRAKTSCAQIAKRDSVRFTIHEYDSLPPLEADRYALFQKTLEAPIHVARKMLEVWGIDLPVRSKLWVERAYKDHIGGELGAFLKKVIDLDEVYTSRVDTFATQRFDEREYLLLLKRIERMVPEVIEFVRENALLVERS